MWPSLIVLVISASVVFFCHAASVKLGTSLIFGLPLPSGPWQPVHLFAANSAAASALEAGVVPPLAFELAAAAAAARLALVAGGGAFPDPDPGPPGELAFAAPPEDEDVVGGATVGEDELLWLAPGLALLFGVSVPQATKKRATSETTKPSFMAFSHKISFQECCRGRRAYPLNLRF